MDGLYQARFRRDGYNIEVASKSFDIMKQKFLAKLLATEKAKQNAVYPPFSDFIADWLKIKKQTVKESTYKSYVNLLSYNILPKFGHYHVNEITRKDIQDFLFELTDNGKNRTAQKLKLLLSAIFDIIVEDYGIKTPMTKIVLSHYEVKKGKAFTKEDERTIIDFCKDNPHYAGNSALLVLLYTGMRIGNADLRRHVYLLRIGKDEKWLFKSNTPNSHIAYAEKSFADNRFGASKSDLPLYHTRRFEEDIFRQTHSRTALFLYNEGERMWVQSRTCYEVGRTRV